MASDLVNEGGPFIATIRGRKGLQIDSVNELLRLINGGARIDKIERLRKGDGEREAIARIIAPMAWSSRGTFGDTRSRAAHRGQTLLQADAILSLITPNDTPEDHPIARANLFGDDSPVSIHAPSASIHANDTPVRGLVEALERMADTGEHGEKALDGKSCRRLAREALASLTSKQTVSVDREKLAQVIHDTIENDDDSGGGAYLRAADAIITMLASAPPLDGESSK